MCEVRELIQRVADTDVTVLIRGESGTGKELVARALHAASPRRNKPFVKVNCAALPTELLESELFGFERGAFTGAMQHKPGKFEFANHGTMFLDEIGDMSFPLQAKLLQVLQDGEFSRLGGKHDVHVDVRIVAATNRDLEQSVVDGQFREDLFFRLNVVCIKLPPLRERREEVPLLCEHFLKKYSVQYNKPYAELSSDTMRLLMDYDWPGNIRELENLIKRTVVLGTEAGIKKDLAQRERAIAMAASPAGRAPKSGAIETRRAAETPSPVPAAVPAPPGSHRRRSRQLLPQRHLPHGGARSRTRPDSEDAPADALEPEGHRRDPRHQLQGPPLQDQGKRPRQGVQIMTNSAFYEEGSKLLTPGAFEFVLDTELKRAVRSQNFLTLIVVETAREWEGMTVTADDGTLQEVAQIIGREVRETDVIGHTAGGTLAIVLLDADFERSERVIDRLVSRIDDYEFPTALRIAVGAACYPTHAVDADSLKRQAMTRPIVNWRVGTLTDRLSRQELRSAQ